MAHNPKDGSSCGCGGPQGTPMPRPMVPLGVPRPVVMPDVWVNGIPPGSIQRLPSAKPMLMPALESPPCDCDCPCPPEALEGKASPMPPMRPPMPAGGPGGGGPGPGGGGPPPGGGGGPPPGGGEDGGVPPPPPPNGGSLATPEGMQGSAPAAMVLGQSMQAAALEMQFRAVQTADAQAAAASQQYRTQLALQGMGSLPTSMGAGASQLSRALQPLARSGQVEGGMPYGGPQSVGTTQVAGLGSVEGASGRRVVGGPTPVGVGIGSGGPTLAGVTIPPIPENWTVSALYDPDSQSVFYDPTGGILQGGEGDDTLKGGPEETGARPPLVDTDENGEREKPGVTWAPVKKKDGSVVDGEYIVVTDGKEPDTYVSDHWTRKTRDAGIQEVHNEEYGHDKDGFYVTVDGWLVVIETYSIKSSKTAADKTSTPLGISTYTVLYRVKLHRQEYRIKSKLEWDYFKGGEDTKQVLKTFEQKVGEEAQLVKEHKESTADFAIIRGSPNAFGHGQLERDASVADKKGK